MKDCSHRIGLVIEVEKFSLSQCPISDLEKKGMKKTFSMLLQLGA